MVRLTTIRYENAEKYTWYTNKLKKEIEFWKFFDTNFVENDTHLSCQFLHDIPLFLFFSTFHTIAKRAFTQLDRWPKLLREAPSWKIIEKSRLWPVVCYQSTRRRWETALTLHKGGLSLWTSWEGNLRSFGQCFPAAQEIIGRRGARLLVTRDQRRDVLDANRATAGHLVASRNAAGERLRSLGAVWGEDHARLRMNYMHGKAHGLVEPGSCNNVAWVHRLVHAASTSTYSWFASFR